jgi:hypothetical protein
MSRNKNLTSADDMRIIASTNNEPPQNFFEAPISYEPSTKLNVMFTKCGHLGPQRASLNFWGNIREFEIKRRIWDTLKSVFGLRPIQYNEVPCPECIFKSMKEHAVRCALCGTGILPGEGVALYHSSGPIPHFELATKVGKCVVGCLGWNCCPSGGFFSGHWTEDGFKKSDFKNYSI